MNVPAEKEKLTKVLGFLTDIGLNFQLTPRKLDSFLSGVSIVDGELYINQEDLISVGDILHEAGHLAFLPPALRAEANDNIEDAFGPEHTYELGVICWSVLAALKLELPLREVFHDQGYKNESVWLLEEYASGNYLGLPLLQWLGMVDATTLAPNAVPKVLHWTRK